MSKLMEVAEARSTKTESRIDFQTEGGHTTSAIFAELAPLYLNAGTEPMPKFHQLN
jgi:hypothetical protein